MIGIETWKMSWSVDKCIVLTQKRCNLHSIHLCVIKWTKRKSLNPFCIHFFFLKISSFISLNVCKLYVVIQWLFVWSQWKLFGVDEIIRIWGSIWDKLRGWLHHFLDCPKSFVWLGWARHFGSKADDFQKTDYTECKIISDSVLILFSLWDLIDLFVGVINNL